MSLQHDPPLRTFTEYQPRRIKYVQCNGCGYGYEECAAESPCSFCGRGAPGRKPARCPLCETVIVYTPKAASEAEAVQS